MGGQEAVNPQLASVSSIPLARWIVLSKNAAAQFEPATGSLTGGVTMFQMRPTQSAQAAGMKPAVLVVLVVLALVSAAPLSAQDLRSDIFREADDVMAAALAARTDVLAPASFGEAEKLYRRAEDNLERGRRIEDIQRDLAKAIEHLKKGIEATKLAEVTLVAPLDARDDAANADAQHYASDLWKKADKKFVDAARALENGDVNRAKKRGDEARVLFRDAELEAIKSNFFNETRALLEKAQKQRVERGAPETIARSRELLGQAEAALERDRYDTDLPRTLAGEAKYEANHAFNIAEIAGRIDKRDLTIEQLILESERPLALISGTVDVVPLFHTGYHETTQNIITHIEALQIENETLGHDLADRERTLANLEAQITDLEEKFGGASEEHLALQRQMEAQAAIRERFDRIQKMFDRDEARVLRDADDVIVRVVGLQFDVATAVIQPQYFALLTRVQDAINLFPGSHLQVEGHTDSHGTDEINLELSEARAQAVREYLIANMRLDQERITAVGHGESQPIANNETAEGRARNRRIDIVITPDLESMVP
jgi:outer membrane protein OmpA-like peptidoglycan-associated protein